MLLRLIVLSSTSCRSAALDVTGSGPRTIPDLMAHEHQLVAFRDFKPPGGQAISPLYLNVIWVWDRIGRCYNFNNNLLERVRVGPRLTRLHSLAGALHEAKTYDINPAALHLIQHVHFVGKILI